MLILAATLSVFVLVLMSGLATRLAQQPAASPTPEAPAIAVASPTPALGLDPTAVQALVAQRERSYQQLIGEANKRLYQANRQLDQSYQKQQSLAAQLNEAYKRQASAPQPAPAELRVRVQPRLQAQAPQPTAAPDPTVPPPPPAPAYAVSPDMALTIATNVAPGAKLTRQPELVNFQGIVAYEVLFDRGAVYVDANSGQVLYNGAAASVSSGGHGGEHEGGDHEDGGHDD
jgi:hypothetical protein